MFVIQFNGTMHSLWRHSWVQDYPEAHFVLITSLSPSTHANLTRLLGLVVFSVLFLYPPICRWIASSISQVCSLKRQNNLNNHICISASLSGVDCSHLPSLSDTVQLEMWQSWSRCGSVSSSSNHQREDESVRKSWKSKETVSFPKPAQDSGEASIQQCLN